jgi:hypothetical protein
MRKDELENVAKIFKVLDEANGWLWIREIARRTNLNHKTVSRLLNKYFLPFIEVQYLPFRVKLVKFKEKISFKKFLNYWKIKKIEKILH